jgi:urate oxidase
VPVELIRHSYGKSQIRLTKVTRLTDRHEVRELVIDIQLEGDFAASYKSGDNHMIIPTDTMKNIAYALAKEYSLQSIEDFGLALAGHFLADHLHVEAATVEIAEQPLERICVRGQLHPHAFSRRSSESRTTTVLVSRELTRVVSGIEDLFLLKSTASAFSGFIRDRYTTLEDGPDRIMATMLNVRWTYAGAIANWDEAHVKIRCALLESFAEHQSLSVQQTLHAMGSAALEASPEIEEITLFMPNKHRILVDLTPFGLENANEVFVATDEPHGVISGTLRRV